MSSWDHLPRGATVGRYMVLERIGSGGMGVVYAAYDPHLDRRIALKLLKPRTIAPGSGLLREARLMAAVQHPQVIGVYDVGVVGDQVFIAMEHVPGRTLKAWLREDARDWREILGVFMQAGEGLAAAHAAGVLHRDFKPDNVLVGSDGRVRVTDFGVARLAAHWDDPTQPMTLAPIPLFGDSTGTGAAIGSPAYMAPEVIDGREGDVRADVFSFCVALYEALYGEPPFEGDDLFKRRAAIASGEIRDAPRGSAVPGWLRKAVLGGLPVDPEDRWPSMNALLAQLSREPVRRWRAAAFSAAGLALAVLVAVLALRGRSAVCQGAERKLAGVWDDARREALRGALPPAEAAAAQSHLDAYARAYVAMRTEACVATRVRGEQSEQLLDLRMECLDRRLADLAALAEVLQAGGAKKSAADAAAALPPLDECANASALREQAPLPRDPASQRHAGALRATLTMASAFVEAGDDARALALARPAQAEAAAAGYKPLVAEASFIIARALTQSGDARGAEAATHRAALDAERARDDVAAARAWISLAWDVGHRQGRGAEGRTWAEYAGAALERAGGDDHLEALRLRALGFIEYDEGKLDDALASFRKAQAMLKTEDELTAMVLEGQGLVLLAQGKAQDALAVQERSLKLRQQALGPDHPHVAFAEDQLADVMTALGRPEDALQHAQRGLALREKSLPADSPFIAWSLSRIGYALHALHRDDEALDAHRRALTIAEKALGNDSRDLAFMLQGIGEELRGLRRPGEAAAALERALELRDRYRVAPGQLGDTRFELAQALWEARQDRERARQLASGAALDYLRAQSLGEREAEAQGKLVAAWLASH